MLDQNSTDIRCRQIGVLLSGFVDNSLSARETWEVEKHLADCAACSQLAQFTEQTVHVLRSANTVDLSDQFMANLQGRLDSLGPVPTRRSFGTVVREWFYDIRRQVNARPIPTLSVGMASFVVAALLFTGKPGAVIVVNPVAGDVMSQEALDRHVAVTASDPFDDPVAAKLEADSGMAGNSAKSGID